MRLAIRQTTSPAGDIRAALALIRVDLAAARAASAEMLVLPELFLPGYNLAEIADYAQPMDGAWMADLSSAVRQAGCALTVGFAERAGARIYNSAVTLSAHGLVVAHHRKIQLYGPREAAVFTAGERLATFDFQGRRAALLICYDIEFAQHLRTLALAGVDLVLVPTACMMPYRYVSDHLVPAQAAVFGLTIAYVNLCGSEGDLTYSGGSLVAGPDGAILAKAGAGPALLIVDLPGPLPEALRPTHKTDYRPADL